MANVNLDRVDSVILDAELFSSEFNSWLSVLVDSLNETIQEIQNQFNGISDGLVVPQKTTAEITTLAATASNGTQWYDTTTNQLKAKINGVVVVIV